MCNIYVQEEFVNVTQNYRYGDSGVFESRFEKSGEAFKAYRKLYGRVLSKVYVGDRAPRAVGWVFQKRVKYDDCNEYFVQEAWVTLHKAPPEHKTTYHYLEEK